MFRNLPAFVTGMSSDCLVMTVRNEFADDHLAVGDPDSTSLNRKSSWHVAVLCRIRLMRKLPSNPQSN